MTGIIYSNNININSLFKAKFSSNTAPLTHFQINGQDLNQLFEPRGNSASTINATHILVNGVDLNIIFMDINFVMPISSSIGISYGVYGNTVYGTCGINNANSGTLNPNGSANWAPIQSPASFTIIPNISGVTVKCVLIGGGAGGGAAYVTESTPNGGGGGGGAGGYIAFQYTVVNPITYTIEIGYGGLGGYTNQSGTSNLNSGGLGSTSSFKSPSFVIARVFGGQVIEVGTSSPAIYNGALTAAFSFSPIEGGFINLAAGSLLEYNINIYGGTATSSNGDGGTVGTSSNPTVVIYGSTPTVGGGGGSGNGSNGGSSGGGKGGTQGDSVPGNGTSPGAGGGGCGYGIVGTGFGNGGNGAGGLGQVWWTIYTF